MPLDSLWSTIRVQGHPKQIHHHLFIALLLGSRAETVLVKQPRYIQTKM